MKNGKKPNRQQGKLMKKSGYDYQNYLVTKDTPDALTIIKRDDIACGRRAEITITKTK